MDSSVCDYSNKRAAPRCHYVFDGDATRWSFGMNVSQEGTDRGLFELLYNTWSSWESTWKHTEVQECYSFIYLVWLLKGGWAICVQNRSIFKLQGKGSVVLHQAATWYVCLTRGASWFCLADDRFIDHTRFFTGYKSRGKQLRPSHSGGEVREETLFIFTSWTSIIDGSILTKLYSADLLLQFTCNMLVCAVNINSSSSTKYLPCKYV